VVEVITESGVARGYPKRLAALLNVLVRNAGIPGEELVSQGVYRIPQVVGNAELDTVVIMEGSNDSVLQISRGDYTRALQKAINVARAAGKEVVVATIPPPTGLHESLTPITESYSTAVRDLAAINNLALADVEALWFSACAELQTCDLYNQPEGLHPNTKGYTALAQIFAAALLGIDLLGPDGRAALAAALGVPVSSVIVGVESSAPATPTPAGASS
jgi:lysophospholipase L1-like esterase